MTTSELAGELSSRPEIRITIRSFGQYREEKGLMPAAPIGAARLALRAAGKRVDEMTAIKSHSPFAVGDIAFAREAGFDVNRMNNYGCSLIWGHPITPTGLRSVIELVEELAERGGGSGLFLGCSAGDTGMAIVLDVDDA